MTITQNDVKQNKIINDNDTKYNALNSTIKQKKSDYPIKTTDDCNNNTGNGIEENNNTELVVFEHIVPKSVKQLWERAVDINEKDSNIVINDRQKMLQLNYPESVNKRISQEYGDVFLSHDVALEEKRKSESFTKNDSVSESPELPIARTKWGVSLRPVNKRESDQNKQTKGLPYGFPRLRRLSSSGDIRSTTNQKEGNPLPRSRSIDFLNENHNDHCIIDVDKLNETDIVDGDKNLSVHERRRTFESQSLKSPTAKQTVKRESSFGNASAKLFYQPDTIQSPTTASNFRLSSPLDRKSAISLQDLLKQDEIKLTVDVIETEDVIEKPLGMEEKQEKTPIITTLSNEDILNKSNDSVNSQTSSNDQIIGKKYTLPNQLKLTSPTAKSGFFYEAFAPHSNHLATSPTEKATKGSSKKEITTSVTDTSTSVMPKGLNESNTTKDVMNLGGAVQTKNSNNIQPSERKPKIVRKIFTASAPVTSAEKQYISPENDGKTGSHQPNKSEKQPSLIQPLVDDIKKLNNYVDKTKKDEKTELKVISQKEATNSIIPNQPVSTNKLHEPDSVEDVVNHTLKDTTTMYRESSITVKKSDSSKSNELKLKDDVNSPVNTALSPDVPPITTVSRPVSQVLKPIRYNKLGQVILDSIDETKKPRSDVKDKITNSKAVGVVKESQKKNITSDISTGNKANIAVSDNKTNASVTDNKLNLSVTESKKKDKTIGNGYVHAERQTKLENGSSPPVIPYGKTAASSSAQQPQSNSSPLTSNKVVPNKQVSLSKQKRRVGKLIIMTGEQRDEQLRNKENNNNNIAKSNPVNTVRQISVRKENVNKKAPLASLSLTFVSNELGEVEDDPNEKPPVVPEVIFNEPVRNVKSIIKSNVNKNKKRKKTKVTFSVSKLTSIHSYPSEASSYQEEEKDLSPSGFSAYQPNSMGIDLGSVIQRERQRIQYSNTNTNDKNENHIIQYTTEGDHFNQHHNQEGGHALLF